MRVAALLWQGKQWMGGWNYYLNMARVLKAHSPGVQLCIFAPVDLDDASRREIEEATGEPARALPPPSRARDIRHLFFGYDRGLADLLEAARIDVVIEQARFLGRRFPIPVLAWIGDLQHRVYPQYTSALTRLTRDVGFWAQTRFRRHVYVSSESAKGDLLRFVRRPAARVHVLPFATVPTIPIEAAAIEAARQRHGLPEHYVFLPNQLWRHKNHATAIRAAGLLAGRGRGVLLAMSGNRNESRDGDYAREIGDLTEASGAGTAVKWLGSVPYADLLHVMAGADAVLNPSFFEGWSTTVEEAKALGAPMILSSIDVHLEQASDRARFFKPDDPEALAALLEGAEANAQPWNEARRQSAAERNLKDQQVYAARLAALFQQAAADG